MGRAVISTVAVWTIAVGLACTASGQTPPPKGDEFKAGLEAIIDDAAKKAGPQPFNSFYWQYEYDGTDASLRGVANQPGRFSEEKRPSIYVEFECSRQWVRFTIQPTNIGRSGENIRRVTVDDRIITIFDGDRPVVASTADAPKRGVIKLVSQLTKAFHAEKEKKIAFEFRSGPVNVDVASAVYPQLEKRDAIVSFREKCSSWWSDF